MVGVYVDDLLMMSASEHLIKNFKRMLSQKSQITDKGELQEFLGIVVDRKDGNMTLSQARMIDKLLADHGTLNCHGSKTPKSTTVDLNESKDSTEGEVCQYQSIFGSLMYIAGSTRPDVQNATNKLAQYMSAPTTIHLNAATRVLKYLKETRNAKLVYKNNGRDDLEIYTDVISQMQTTLVQCLV